ncbi:MAG: hypothetical protein JWN46_3745 [Acidimicrobiales bacterium]|nr:hypothetical protein [Acidimicrobiales bacterium]
MRLTSERCYDFPLDAEAFWSVIDRTDSYRDWWPWLRSFDADGLHVGDRWSCVIRPPLPYLVRITVELREVDPARLVVADISGDLAGTARLEIEDLAAGCRTRLLSSLAPERGVLRALSTVAPAVARSGHEAVLDRGARQLADRLRVDQV